MLTLSTDPAVYRLFKHCSGIHKLLLQSLFPPCHYTREHQVTLVPLAPMGLMALLEGLGLLENKSVPRPVCYMYHVHLNTPMQFICTCT